MEVHRFGEREGANSSLTVVEASQGTRLKRTRPEAQTSHCPAIYTPTGELNATVRTAVTTADGRQLETAARPLAASGQRHGYIHRPDCQTL